jgi:hypothetical protein
MKIRIFCWLMGMCLPALLSANGSGCPAGRPIGEFRLAAAPPGGGVALPLQTLQTLPGGATLMYFPGSTLAPQEGQVAVLVAPEGDSPLQLLEPRPLDQPASWTTPYQVTALALIWGPDGLDREKIVAWGKRDREVIDHLARYAEQTAQTEALIQALSSPNQDLGRDLDVAIRSFANQYGAGGRLNRDAPADQQTLAMLRALNPALATYDPLRKDSRERMQQSATLAASVAGLFFGSTVGLGAGGAALLMNLRTLAFPRMELRSTFARLESGDRVSLCARPEARDPRTKLAYVWARSFSSGPAPRIEAAAPRTVPLGVRSVLEVEIRQPAQLGQIRQWRWVAEDGRRIAAQVRPVAGQAKLEVLLPEQDVAPGRYQLEGLWDWTPVSTPVEVTAQPLPDLRTAQPSAASREALVAGSGKRTVELEGADFQFVEGIELAGQKLPVRLPRGLGQGLQDKLETEVDVTNLTPGTHRLALIQSGGSRQEIDLPVLPRPPALTGIPVRLNAGEPEQTVTLRGERLDLVDSVAGEGFTFSVDRLEEKALRVRARAENAPPPGVRLALSLRLRDRQTAVEVPEALEMVGPRPRILAVRPSRPARTGIELAEGELASHVPSSFAVSVAHVNPRSEIQVGCEETALELAPARVRIGGQVPGLRVERSRPDSLFVVVEPARLAQPGCQMTLRVANDVEGASAPVVLGRVIRVPSVTRFELTDEPAEEGFAGVLEGTGLEWIDRVGWDPEHGVPVRDLPVPAPDGRQTLRVVAPWPAPAPHAPLFLWLRGEPQGRKTTVRW